jgi:hypothetical protein
LLLGVAEQRRIFHGENRAEFVPETIKREVKAPGGQAADEMANA